MPLRSNHCLRFSFIFFYNIPVFFIIQLKSQSFGVFSPLLFLIPKRTFESVCTDLYIFRQVNIKACATGKSLVGYNPQGRREIYLFKAFAIRKGSFSYLDKPLRQSNLYNIASFKRSLADILYPFGNKYRHFRFILERNYGIATVLPLFDIKGFGFRRRTTLRRFTFRRINNGKTIPELFNHGAHMFFIRRIFTPSDKCAFFGKCVEYYGDLVLRGFYKPIFSALKKQLHNLFSANVYAEIVSSALSIAIVRRNLLRTAYLKRHAVRKRVFRKIIYYSAATRVCDFLPYFLLPVNARRQASVIPITDAFGIVIPQIAIDLLIVIVGVANKYIV